MSLKFNPAGDNKYVVPLGLIEDNEDGLPLILKYKMINIRALLLRVVKSYDDSGAIDLNNEAMMQYFFDELDSVITGWENVKNPDGTPLEFKNEYLEMLPFSIQMDFINSVIVKEMSKVTETEGAEIKN